jgi:Leucine-rich repeat (LRR) protein
MPTQARDQAIVAILAEKIGDLAGRASYDEEGNLVVLNLSGLNLSQWPAEPGQLTKLQELTLHGNHLSQLPAELGQMINLQTLYLFDSCWQYSLAL